MRVVMIGASPVAITTANLLLKKNNEVVIVEIDKKKIDTFSDIIDCGFIEGDGSNPKVLQELNPEITDYLFCLTDSDQNNIIASLIGKSLGFNRVITKIETQEYVTICQELGLDDTILPSQTIGRFLADMVEGLDILELSTYIKGDARFFYFIAEKNEGKVEDIEIPDSARVICVYREGKLKLTDKDSEIKKDDEVVILTHSKSLPQLKERWKPKLKN
jgi:trk system potassium uptake protein TrkA